MTDERYSTALHGCAAIRGTPGTTCADVEVVALQRAAKVRIQARAVEERTGLPLEPNTATGTGPWALWRAPGDWLAYDTERSPAELVRWAAERAPAAAWVTDTSSSSTIIELRGSSVPTLLMRDCPIDLEGGSLPPGGCLQTVVAATAVMMHRQPDGTTWRLFVERSAARHVWDWLEDSVAVAMALEP
jgi:heterotetrameric sarcosine oxidase gamma subunit